MTGLLRGEDYLHSAPPGLHHLFHIAQAYRLHARKDEDGESPGVDFVVHSQPAFGHGAALVQHFGMDVGEVYAEFVGKDAGDLGVVCTFNLHAASDRAEFPVQTVSGILGLHGVQHRYVRHVPPRTGEHVAQSCQKAVECGKVLVVEGIAFSLRDTLEIFRASGKEIDDIISIGGGAKNPQWLQMQADIFNAKIYQLQNEQGPSIGACMIALVGSGLVASFEEAVEKCVAIGEVYEPIAENVAAYNEIYRVYTQIYAQTKSLNEALQAFR